MLKGTSYKSCSYPGLVSSYIVCHLVFPPSSILSSIYQPFQCFYHHITMCLPHAVSQPVSLPTLDDIQHCRFPLLFQTYPHVSFYPSRKADSSFSMSTPSFLSVQVSATHTGGRSNQTPSPNTFSGLHLVSRTIIFPFC